MMHDLEDFMGKMEDLMNSIPSAEENMFGWDAPEEEATCLPTLECQFLLVSKPLKTLGPDLAPKVHRMMSLQLVFVSKKNRFRNHGFPIVFSSPVVASGV